MTLKICVELTKSRCLWVGFCLSILRPSHDLSNSHDIQSTLSPLPRFLPPLVWSSFIFQHSIMPTSQQVIPQSAEASHMPPLLSGTQYHKYYEARKTSTKHGTLQMSPEDSSLQNANTKPAQQSTRHSDAMHMTPLFSQPNKRTNMIGGQEPRPIFKVFFWAWENPWT